VKKSKSDKMEKWKSDKKVSKIEVPPKTPKCHLNGQNRQFVKSEPPGWALFEFQGVPRDPVLRPKSDPLFLNVKKWRVFTFWWFSFCAFCWFSCFVNCTFWSSCHFLTLHALCVIRPYCNYIVGAVHYVWWFSPHNLAVHWFDL